jgi:hypothetical protein
MKKILLASLIMAAFGSSAKAAMTVSGQSLYKNTVVLSVVKSF